MDDRQRVALWQGIRIPTNRLRLENAVAVLQLVLADVSDMSVAAGELEPPLYTRGNLPLATDLTVAACGLGGALDQLGRAISSLGNCSELSDLDGNPV